MVILIWLAFAVRLIAALASQGYAIHNDHFLVIETAQSWINKTDVNQWLPSSQDIPNPAGYSFFYPGVHYILFSFFEYIHIYDPKSKMLAVRLLHALFSLLVVFYGFKLAERTTSKHNARKIGLVLALLWFFPFVSVHNMVEAVTMPLLLIAIYQLHTVSDGVIAFRDTLVAGFTMAIAFAISYNTVFFALGTAITLLLVKPWRYVFYFVLGLLIGILIFEGIIDTLFWGKPLVQFLQYAKNVFILKNYFNESQLWYIYLTLLLFAFSVPYGIFIFFGYIKSYRKHLLLFLPVLIYIMMHYLIPEKQEQYILPIFPIYVVAGFTGWNMYYESKVFHNFFKLFVKYSFLFFLVLNVILLVITTLTYSKRSRVESMVYLSGQKNEIDAILIEDTNKPSVARFPVFYAGKDLIVYTLAKRDFVDNSVIYSYTINNNYIKDLNSIEFFKTDNTNGAIPDYVLFVGDNNLEKRVASVQRIWPYLSLDAVIENSFGDKFMQFLNPINYNMPVYIYKVSMY